jgi:iron-sulfur cluster insertion protein
MQMIFTPAAIARIKELLAKQNKDALRISVEGGGCSGFLYNYQLINAEEIAADDMTINAEDVKIVVDDVSQGFLDGCKLDFVQELGSNYFNMVNPQATAKCGCGNSFAI